MRVLEDNLKRFNILGVLVDAIGKDDAPKKIAELVETGNFHLICTVNPEFVCLARDDSEFNSIINSSSLRTIDGVGIVHAIRLLYGMKVDRVTGVDTVNSLLGISQSKDYRVMFIGGREDSVRKAVEFIKRRYPKLIAEFVVPPFEEFSEETNSEIDEKISKFRPDLLFVSLGAMKQEKWIDKEVRGKHNLVAIGVGGTIDFLSGEAIRAPAAVQAIGLEWFFRLFIEPRRWKRQITTYPRFAALVFGQMVQNALARMKNRCVRNSLPLG